jgi:hypothetical protein
MVYRSYQSRYSYISMCFLAVYWRFSLSTESNLKHRLFLVHILKIHHLLSYSHMYGPRLLDFVFSLHSLDS